MTDSIDSLLASLPFAKTWFNRTYSYFRKHTAITNVMHVLFGLGLGFLIAGGELAGYGIAALAASFLGHVYAFMKGR